MLLAVNRFTVYGAYKMVPFQKSILATANRNIAGFPFLVVNNSSKKAKYRYVMNMVRMRNSIGSSFRNGKGRGEICERKCFSPLRNILGGITPDEVGRGVRRDVLRTGIGGEPVGGFCRFAGGI